jgi:tetratricopeptide (TPR) repeat protein/predicted Ser/Thr protein kinase
MASIPKPSPEPDNRGNQPDPAAQEGRNAAAVLTPPPSDLASSDAAHASDAPTLIDQPFDSPILVDTGHRTPVSGSDAPTQIDLTAPRVSGAATQVAGGQPLLPPGTLLANRYEITALLGEGGMGAVYKANDRELNRPVALKVIRPDLAKNQSIVDRFKQELLLAREVTHKNVIRIYDLGESEGLRFITMEFVEGEDLRSLLLERKKLPADEAVNIMQQVCRALDAAHTVGVIHRDLKPQNIMRDHSGRILVMDFGLARTLEGDGMTQTGALVGTMDYMSPEQALGKELDQRSDLFAIGLIFYELLTGKMPYRADSAIASLLKRTQERAAPVLTHDATIPSALSDVVSKCLDPDVKLRYQTAREILADLEAWQGGRAGATLRFPASQRPWGQTIPWHWVGGAAAVLVLAAVGFMLRGKLSSTKAPAASGPVVSVAVLPFHNASGDPAADWLGSSIAEMLTTDVGQSAKVHVTSSDSMHQLLRDLKISANTSLDDGTVRRLAQFSNADQIVVGQYVKLGDQIRLDATIQDLKHQRSTQLKAEAANEQALFAAVDHLAQEIRNNLAVSDSVMHELSSQAFRPSTKSVQAIHYYNQGLELVRDGKNLEAVTNFESSIKEDPNFALGYSKLGETYAKLGYGDKADEASRKAVDLAQQLPAQERYRVLASQALVSNDTKKAIEYYENLATAAPEDSSILLALAQLDKNAGSYDTAREYLLKVLGREPNNAEALVNIAEVEGERRNPQGALDYLNRALTLAIQLDNDELRSRVMYETGHTYRLLNKPEEALRNYQDSLAIRRRLGQEAGIAQTLAEIAEIQYSQGKPDIAIASYKEAMQLQREIGDKTYLSHTLLNLGGIYSDRGQYDDALKYLKESLQLQRELHDENYEAMCLSNIGTVYFFTNRYDDALTYYQQSLQLLEKLNATGELPAVLYNLGDTSTRMGQFDKAIAYYLRGLQMGRTANNKELTAFGAYSMATVFRYQGRYDAAATSDEEALKAYRELNERSSSMAEALNGYGQTLAILGRSEESDKALQESLALAREIKDDANVSQALNYQGERALYAGDLKSAKSLFDQALQTAERNKDRERILRAKINLAQLAVSEGHGQVAVNDLKRLEKEADDSGLKYLAVQCAVLSAEAHLSVKDYRKAQQEADRALKASEKLGFKFLAARAHYIRGELLHATKDPEQAASQYQQAHRLLEDVAQESHSGSFLKRGDVAAILAAK